MRTYDAQTKIEAVLLSKEIGAYKASQELGIPGGTIRTWMEKERERPLPGLSPGKGQSTLQSFTATAENDALVLRQLPQGRYTLTVTTRNEADNQGQATPYQFRVKNRASDGQSTPGQTASGNPATGDTNSLSVWLLLLGLSLACLLAAVLVKRAKGQKRR